MLNADIAKKVSSMLPLAARDFLGGSPMGQSLGTPGLSPLATPEVRQGGKFKQLLGGAADLKPLTELDRVPGIRKGGAPQSEHEKVTAQAQKWVAQTFYGTLMKQMHDSPFKSDLFSGGRGAEAFQPLMDQRLIDHMTKGSGQKLVRGIVRQIEGRANYRRQQAAQSSGSGSATEAGYEGVNAANKTTPKDEEPGDLGREGPPPNRRTRVAPGLRA